MESPEELEPAAAGWVVLVLSTDRSFTDELALELSSREPGVELHVARAVSVLFGHLQRIFPDAVVVDTTGLTDVDRQALVAGWLRARVPTVLLTRGSETPTAWLGTDAGPVDAVERRGNFVEATRRALMAGRHLAGVDGRLQETVRHYHDILDAMSDGIFVLVHGFFSYANEGFAAAVGRTPRELESGVRFVDLLPGENRTVIEEDLARLEVGRGRRELFEMSLHAVGGTVRRFEVACRASVVEGRRAVVGVARDVTSVRDLQDEIERARQRAAQIERLRALGELAAGVAHDFNNVLETVLGRVQRARERLSRGESCGEDLAIIEGATRNAAETVKRIHEFARPSGADSWHDVDLASVARDAVEYVRTQLPKQVTLEFLVDTVPRIRGNGAELREVMLNLLGNAIDAIDGEGTIRVRCFAEGTAAILEVEDTGIGMTPAVQRRIYEPFFSTKAEAGTGLGLSVSHGILRRHDAEIHLQSEPGKGTQFRLIFQALTPLVSGRATIARDSLRILVLDDDPAIAELLQDLLQEMGHEVQLVQDLNEALTVVAESPIDLMITDLDLPNNSGWQVARSVRRVRPEILVGLVTGWPLNATIDELKAQGVDFVLAKPFSIDTLTHAIVKVCGTK
jgi:PAS domain S-box-containing protein